MIPLKLNSMRHLLTTLQSHKGPVLTYIAPASSNGNGNVWVKLAQEGYANGKWAVDNLIANRGKHSVTLPNLAPGDYLLRPEIIALHEGNRASGTQFYMECVQIRVTSSGSVTLPAGVAIPGAYKATDPGVLFNIYGSFSSYTIPGPAVWNGASGGSPAPAPTSTKAPAASSAAPRTTLVTSAKPVATGALAPLYGQCGGQGWTGPTACVSGATCKANGQYYSQCLPN